MKNTSALFAVLFVLALASGPWLLLGLWLDHFGALTDGTVSARHESIALYRSGQWEQVYTIEYRYRAADDSVPVSVSQRVPADLYQRLRQGMQVKVRYSPWPPLRLLHGYGSALAEAPFLYRLPATAPGSAISLLELTIFGLGCTLSWFACRRGSWSLGLIGALPIVVFLAASVLLGFIVFPLVALAWRRHPGRGFGLLFFVALGLSIAVLWWRIPAPPALLDGPRANTVATVRQSKRIEDLFGGWRSGGETLRQPFVMLDLEFTPAGSNETVHAVDLIDADSIEGLQTDARVPINYSSENPRLARVQNARRSFSRMALQDMVGLSIGLGLAVCVAGWLLTRLSGRFSRFTRLATQAGARNAAPALADLPADDPRRAAILARLGERGRKLPEDGDAR